jgi:arsenate reductase (thioredoxin)
MQKRRVLFACTHNSARSQMAEALLRSIAGDRFEALSAGTEAAGIRPETITVMEEVGISLAGQRSKSIDEFRGEAIDTFITVCDDAREACPVLPGAGASQHWSIDDPAAVDGPERLDAFRAARDELRRRIEAFVQEIP